MNKQETLEEVADRLFKTHSNNTSLAEGHYDYMMDKEDFKEASLEIAKWQQQKMYSKEDMLDFAWYLIKNVGQYSDDRIAHFEGKYLEQFKKK
jgi:hypothetical protein